jgi:hypothetical protein
MAAFERLGEIGWRHGLILRPGIGNGSAGRLPEHENREQEEDSETDRHNSF